MKNTIYIILTILIMVGCTKDITIDTNIVKGNGPTFEAAFADNQTRTFVDENVKLLWTAEDKLSVVFTTLNEQYIFDGLTGDNSGTFTHISSGQLSTGNALSTNYAVYPYDKNIKISNEEVITLTMPSTQEYAAKSFGLGANTMVAVTDGPNSHFLPFKNLGGFLKLKLYGDNITVKSIELTGGKSEIIAGTAIVTAEYGEVPALEMDEDGISSITLDCGEGVEIGSTEDTATEFWIVVPPTTFENGFTVAVTEVGGGKCFRMTSNSVSIERNTVRTMAPFKLEYTMPTNELWYTSLDGNIVEPYNTDGFGAEITSNT